MPVYTCYCGKFRNPEFDPHVVSYIFLFTSVCFIVVFMNVKNPHGCEGLCGKKRGVNCRHPCDTNCHPGPCPPCTLKGGVISCYCKKKKKEVFCSDSQTSFECGGSCAKKLNCGIHTC
jgi:transcriptional repressor NF-X1